MSSRTSLVAAALLALAPAACSRSDCPPAPTPTQPSAPSQPTTPSQPTPPTTPAAAAKPDCGALTGANAVQTEMRMLECTLQLVVTAIGRNDLASVPPAISTLHAAKEATEQALHAGAYKPMNGDVAAFAALDEAFHASLVTLVQAAGANDHAATAAAMGTVLAGCQGCHATFRPTMPPAPSTPPAAPTGHAH